MTHHSGGGQHNEEDDLNDLLHVFDFFEVFDGGETPDQLPLKPPVPIPTQSLDEPPIVKPRRGRKKKVIEAIKVEDQDLSMAPGSSPISKDDKVKSEITKSSTTTKLHTLSGAEKERLRRENNKQSARNSRKKKKEYVQILTESISSLTQEVGNLREQLQKKASEDDHREKLACLGRQAFLDALEMHGPCSHKRKLSAIYQFENLTRNVAPPHTRFLLWTVARRATEADSAASKTWHEVSQIMSLQREQQERLGVVLRSKKATDNTAAEEREKLQYVFNVIQKLRSVYDRSSTRLREQQASLLSILSPAQQAILLDSVEKSSSSVNSQVYTGFAFNRANLSPDLQRIHLLLTTAPSNPQRSIADNEQQIIDYLMSFA